MKTRWKTVLLIFTGVMFLLGAVPFAVAQETGQDTFTLEEVTVTAAKREENQQKVGIAMEVITGEQMKELGRNDVDQILQNISTALVQRTADGLRIGLRGVTYDTPAGYGDGTGATPSTVSINIDGVFTQRKPSGTGLYDVERVEVLYGPQTTTYASNAPGGIVNLELAKPKLDKYEVSGILEYGNFDLLRSEAVVNAPMGDTFALRAAYSGSVRDGYLSNGGDDEDSKSGRVRALWAPNDKLSILISGEYQTSISRGTTSVPGFKNQDDVADPWHTDVVLTGLPTNTKFKKFWGHIDYEFGFANLTLIPARTDEEYYRTSTTVLDDGSTSFGASDGDGYEEGIEVRLISPDDLWFQWMLAYNYYEGDVFRYQTTEYSDLTLYPGPIPQSITEMYLYLKNECLLGNVTFPIGEQLRLKAGLRISKDQAISSRTDVRTVGPGRNTYSDMTYDSFPGGDENPDYMIGVEYDVNDSSMFYATVASSYRVEQEAMQWDGSTIPPQEMMSYTAGIKNRFLDNRLQVNLSAFYYDYTNRISQAMQFPTIAMPPTPPFSYCDPNAEPGDPNYAPVCGSFRPDEGGRVPADLTMKGVDVQTNWIITNQDRLDVSVSYLDSWIDKMIANYEFKDQPYATPEASDFSDREPTFSPDWTVTLNYAHNFYLPNGANLTARYDTRYQSKYQVDWWETRGGVDRSGYIDQEAHHIDNFTLVYGSADDKWSFTAYVKNAWDYAEKRFMTAMADIQMNIGPPRTYGAIFSVRY